MTVSNPEELIDRIEALEREHAAQRGLVQNLQVRNSRYLITSSAFVLVLAAGLLMGAAQNADEPAVMEANQFVVRDGDGNVRARFGLNDRGSSFLSLSDSNGAGQIVLLVPEDGFPHVDVSNRDVGHLMLSVRSDGDMALDFLDQDRKGQIALMRTEDGLPHLSLVSEDGEGHVELGVNEQGSGGLAVGRFPAGPNIEIMASPGHDPSIVFTNSDGQRIPMGPAEQ